MTYEKFEKIMNKHLFQDEKIRLLEKIAEEPYRFIGIYRSIL